SFDGATMRKLMSKPRDDQWDTVGLQTIFKMGAYNDKLFFSDNYTTGLFVYDAAYDAIHRAHLKSDYDGATDGDTVRGIWQYGDQLYFSVQEKGVLKVNTGSVFDVGGANLTYGAFVYPYLQTSMFGGDFPNCEKLFYRITLWHSPIVAGQKFHLHMSRNGMASYSAAHTIVPTTGASRTEYIFADEGTSGSGGFDGTPTGAKGIKAEDLSLILAMQTNSSSSQFTLYGFVIDYLPLPRETQRLHMQIAAVDQMQLPDGSYDPKRGAEKADELWASYLEQRPVVVEHPKDPKGTTRTMLITNYREIVPQVNLENSWKDDAVYPLESVIMLELTEC
ncbi:MAG: hypothetical protein ACYC3G_00805, partial [Minisyncoccota bacterium]